MATARPITLGSAPPHGRQACVLCRWTASAISLTADLAPLLAPVAVAFLVFA